jgi:hypothetical protein
MQIATNPYAAGQSQEINGDSGRQLSHSLLLAPSGTLLAAPAICPRAA